MDDELRAELEGLRRNRDQQQQTYTDEQAKGRSRLLQFLDEMKGQGASSYPLMERSTAAVEAPNTSRNRFRRSAPPAPVTRWRVIERGWPVGWPNRADDFDPQGHRSEPLLSERGTFHHFLWTRPEELRSQGAEVPASGIVRLQENDLHQGITDWCLVVHANHQHEPNYEFHGNLTAVAELLAHYLDNPLSRPR